MKNLILSVAFLGLLGSSAQAGLTLGTNAPPGTPLTMAAGTTSGPMLVNIVSDNYPNDIMTAWNVTLEILPVTSTTGTLTFQDPATGTPPNPATNNIFGSDGYGIAATNLGSQLSANDFFYSLSGASAPSVPGAPGANLLQMDFLASPTASGLFGIYAFEGTALTQWTDADAVPSTQLFSNVPAGTGTVLIGEVLITAVPEPGSIVLLGTGGAALAGWLWRRKQFVSSDR